MDVYQILLTLYGPGGRYNPEKGIVIILSAAKRMGRKNRAHTIVHEIVHIGIEQNIVQKYHLAHWEKEHLVDLICTLYLHDLMPDYDMQPKGDKRLDPFVCAADIINNLPLAIEKFIAMYPR